MFYIVALFLLAHTFFALKLNNGKTQFFISGGNQGWAKTGFSLAATILGASAVFGSLKWGAKYGIAGSSFLLTGATGLLFLYVLIPLIPSKKKYFTLPHLISSKSGKFGRKITSLVLIPAWIAIVAAQFKALWFLMEPYSPISELPLLLLFALIISLYLIRGGQKAVFNSDFLQVIILFAGIIIALIFISPHWPSIYSEPPNNISENRDGILILIPIFFAYLAGPDIHSRLLSSKNNDTKRKAIILAFSIIVLFSFAISFLGWSIGISSTAKSNHSMVHGFLFSMPSVMQTILVLAIIGAIISSADTTLFTLSVLFAEDLMNKGVKLARFSIIFFAVISVMIASKGKALIPMMLIAYSIFTGVLGAPILSSLFLKKPLSISVLLTSVTGSSIILLSSYLFPFRFGATMALIFGALVILFSHLIERLRVAHR